MISKQSTATMSREEWLVERRKSIGGSDAGTILGFNKFNSAYALWAEKTGKLIPPDISDKEAVRTGNDLEDYVAQRFMEATGKHVRRCNAIISNSEYPFAHACPDRLVDSERAGLECKTTSSWDILKRCQAGDYPETWYAQCVHYMMVTGLSAWYLAVLVLGHGFYYFTIERDEAEIAALAAAEAEFWQLVERNTEPPMDGSQATEEAIAVIYAESDRDAAKVDLTAVGDAVSTYLAAGKQIKEMKQVQDRAKETVQQFMASAEKGELPDVASVSWAPQTRTTFDHKLYEKEVGKLPQQYFKSSTSRVFKVTAK